MTSIFQPSSQGTNENQTTMKEIFRVEECDKYGNHFASKYFFSSKKEAQQYAKNFTNPNSYIYIQKYLLMK